MPHNILILGAAYGSLLASKMLFGGHKIHHVCLPAEADLINAEGFRVRLPVKGRKDPVGWNQGLGDLASGTEVLAYFEDVMRHSLLPSGRVQYFPLCDVDDDGFVHRLTSNSHAESQFDIWIS